jgi:dihydrofolate reductase
VSGVVCQEPVTSIPRSLITHHSSLIAELVLIAALAERSRVIGRGLDLPWHLPADLKRFKALTSGHPVIMGRRTFEALLHQNGRPLPGRENVVLTRGAFQYEHPDVHVVGSLEDALLAFADRPLLFIGGGASLYAQVLGAEGDPVIVDRMELTIVEADPAGNAYFPPWEHLAGTLFERTAVEAHPPEAGRPAFRFETYERRRQAP